MSEPGRFNLENLVAALPIGRVTLLAAALAIVAAGLLSRETLIRIPEFFEIGFGYDSQLRSTLSNRGQSTDSIDVTLVDIDDAALASWSTATHTTPRDKLATLIDKIVSKGPALVFVDFDLSGVSQVNGDDKLKATLTAYKPDSPPLLLTGPFREPSCADIACTKQACKPAARVDGIDALPFEDATAGKANIIWVSSSFLPDGDGVVRNWLLWRSTCKNGIAQTAPSPQLAAAALLWRKQPDGRADLAEGARRLQGYLPAPDSSSPGTGDWPANTEAYAAPIPFIIDSNLQAKASNWRAASGYRFQRVSALSLDKDQVADEAIKRRAVVLGASYGADKFLTPVGAMPGAALFANAIAVAPAVLNHRPASAGLLFLLSLVLAACYGIFAKLLRAIPAGLLIFVLSYCWLSVTTYLLIPSDAVEVTSRALIYFGVFLAFDALLEMAEAYKHVGWLGALLRHPPDGHKAKAKPE